jgi:molybdopterin converting factor small subunit
MTNETTTSVQPVAIAVEQAAKPAKKATKPKTEKPAKKATKAAKKPAKATKQAAKPKAEKKPKVVTTGSVIPAHYRAEYAKTKIEVAVVGEDGKKSKKAKTVVDNGDEVAALLRGKDLDSVYALVAKRTGVATTDLQKRYSHLNVGMQRMNLGNKLRAAL